jgi:hypothetical protein
MSEDQDTLDDEQDTPPAGGTRRRIPADDVPRAYSRPALSRRPPAERQPQVSRPPAALPDTSTAYNTPTPRPARSRRDKRPRPSSPAAPPVDKRGSGLYLPWWSLIIMLVFVGCAAVGALLVVNSIGGNTVPGGQTPVVVVITSTFTVGPPASQTPIPVPATITPTAPLPTIPPTASLPPGDFAIGETVKVVGVGLNGLNVRSAPGTGSTIKFHASEEEHYVLKDGPQTASSDEWWFIQDPNDPNRGGWASRRFLTVIQQ